MPTISQKNKDKISEHILHYLFSIYPQSAFTNSIASETARDEEFTKFLLSELKKKNLIIEINKNPRGKEYTKRQRWRLSQEAFDAYKKHQSNSQQSF